MNEKLQQFIKDRIESLPQEAREAINVFDWIKLTEEIGKKYLLSETRISYLLVETLLVLARTEDLDSYEDNIEYEVGTTKEEAEKIADEVSAQVFKPIEEKIEENIKKSLTHKIIKAEDNINFILSGGNYGVFMGNPNEEKTPARPHDSSGTGGDKLLGTSNILEVKNRLIN